MKASDLPVTRFSIPFANGAGPSYIRVIPVNSQIGIQDGAASLTDGFVPVNFLPVAAGGVPPFGQDMNGVLFETTAWTRWQNAGAAIPWDSAFASAIGGYPSGALVAAASAHFTASITGAVLTVSAVASGVIAVGQAINAAGVGRGTFVTSFGTGSGGTGTYNLSVSQTVGSEAMISGIGQFWISLVDDNITNPDAGGAGWQAISFLPRRQPTQTKLTVGSGTYTTPIGATRLFARWVAAGASGGSSGIPGGNNGVDGGLTSFAGIVANPGIKGTPNTGTFTAGSGGLGGNGGSGTATLRIPGGDGSSGVASVAGVWHPGGLGGGGFFGGAGAEIYLGAGGAGRAPGAGGAGASGTGNPTGSAGGGGAGEYAELSINSPAASYPYVVGVGGPAAAPGTNGFLSGAGADGLIIVDEFYD